MEKKEKVNQITEGVIWKQLLLFFFPIVFGTFFQQIYNTADTIVVGRFVGKQALAAVGGSASQIANLIVGFFVGLSSGAAVVISQFYGAKDKKNLSKALHTAFAFSIAAGIVLTVVGIFLTRPALLLMKTPADVVEDSAVSVSYTHLCFQSRWYCDVQFPVQKLGNHKKDQCQDSQKHIVVISQEKLTYNR